MTKLRVVTSHGVRIISQQTGWDCNENFVPAYGKRPLPQNLCGEKVRVHYDCAFIRETGIFCSTTARPTTHTLTMITVIEIAWVLEPFSVYNCQLAGA